VITSVLYPCLQKCQRCKGPIGGGEIGVVAPKFGDDVLWHPACFTCDSCSELLVDLTYCVHDDELYCERHYAEQLKPRCASCDEVSSFFAIFCSFLAAKNTMRSFIFDTKEWKALPAALKTVKFTPLPRNERIKYANRNLIQIDTFIIERPHDTKHFYSCFETHLRRVGA